MRIGAALIALPILAGISPAFAAGPHPAGQIPGLADAREAYRSLPLAFEPNRGQGDPRVKFMARSQGLTLFLTATDAMLVTREASLKMRVLGANPAAAAQGLDELPEVELLLVDLSVGDKLGRLPLGHPCLCGFEAVPIDVVLSKEGDANLHSDLPAGGLFARRERLAGSTTAG